MKGILTAITIAAVLAARPLPARAMIRTEVVVLVGVELDPATGRKAAADSDRLARLGLRVVVSPSLWYGGKTPRFHYFVGRQVGTLPVDHPDRHAAMSVPVPDAAAVAAAERALRQAGFAGTPQLIAVAESSGGK